MRKYILFILCLCIHGIARGQTGFDYRYWFDNDVSRVLNGHSATNQWQIDADLAGLSESLHAIHIQVIDDKGNMSSPVTRHFLKLRSRNVREGYYWFESDSKARKLMGQIQGAFSIDVSALPQGFHTIYFQMVGEDGTLSSVTSRSFYKVTVPKALTYRCWVDDDLSTMTTGNYTGGTMLIDLGNVSEGYHVLRTQVEGTTLSSVVSRPFFKVPQIDGMKYLRCICSIDNEQFLVEDLAPAGGIVHWNFDVSTLPYGFHRIQVRVMTPTGAETSNYDSFFLRIPTTDEMNNLKLVYAIDGAEYHTEGGSMSNGVFHCDLDVAHLTDGLHRIVYKLSNGRGVETKTQTQFFLKTPVGGNGIVEYHYWLNDSTNQVSKVRLERAENPLKLISMLPLPKHPINSQLFQFEIDKGKPVVYSKNNLHIRFYDTSGRFTDASAEFVDYSVKQEVTDIERLISGVRATTQKPTGDDIKWYQFDAEPGDSVQFLLDRAATVQVFAPSGKELLNVCGYDAVNVFGSQVNESGTYYVAMHDVTAQEGNDINIDYLHLDKYAVLRQDVSVVGNGGFNTITFEGNGFDELKSVDLVSGKNTLTSVEIGHESNGVSSVKFNFDGARLGVYQAVFHFAGRDITVENCITVEPAHDIDLDVKATWDRNFLMAAGKIKYKFSVTNRGNMTVYNAPLMIRIYTRNAESLRRVDIEGYDLKKQLKDIYGEHYTARMENEINAKMEVSGDRVFFLEADSTDIVDTWGTHVHEVFVCPDIPPYTTKDITVSLTLREPVYCYMWYPDAWNEGSQAQRARKASDGSKCKRSPFEMQHQHNCAQNAWAAQSGLDDEDYLPFPNEDCRDYAPNPMPCPSPYGPGGPSNPVNSFDPNNIFGYKAESGSKAVRDSLVDVNYTIEFENDPEYATAPAHDIYITDTLDMQKFDLSTFEPSRIMIGKKSMDLTGEKDFVVTMDMRPEINAIAKVEGALDMNTGIFKCHISSLDPMTMEPTTYIWDGVLPVNGAKGTYMWDYDDEPVPNWAKGTFMWDFEDTPSGMGELSFNISLKEKLAHGTKVNNQAGIVFDINDVIMTPTWTNLIDKIMPESRITDVTLLNDSTASVSIDATDNGSGCWKYDVYVQYGEGSGWWKAAENVPIDTMASVKVYDGINQGFYVLVTDSAGNVEKKEKIREYVLDMSDPDAIEVAKIDTRNGETAVYDLQGRRVEKSAMRTKGIYIVNDKKKVRKIVRR